MKCFPDIPYSTHMPFVVEHRGRQLLLFSYAVNSITTMYGNLPEFEYQPWQLGWSDWLDEEDGVHPILTYLPEGSVSCNVVATSINNELYISFISKSKVEDGYGMFAIRGEDIDRLNHPVKVVEPPIWSGFSTPATMCVIPPQRDGLIINGKVYSVAPFLDDLIRAVPAGNNIIITGRKNHGLKTYLFSDGMVSGELQHEGESLYKSFLFGEDIVFARQKDAQAFEARELHWGAPQIVPVDISPSNVG